MMLQLHCVFGTSSLATCADQRPGKELLGLGPGLRVVAQPCRGTSLGSQPGPGILWAPLKIAFFAGPVRIQTPSFHGNSAESTVADSSAASTPSGHSHQIQGP